MIPAVSSGSCTVFADLLGGGENDDRLVIGCEMICCAVIIIY